MLQALDLFAGTGWGVACRRLGIEEMGVDNAKAVIATREANGMTTIFEDVWAGLEGEADLGYELLIASPPCQTFSPAGNGAGRRALGEVIQLLREQAYRRPEDMHAFSLEHGDPRTALVLTPLSYIHLDRPTYVVLEQVRSVLPVWEAMATAMRDAWGYSVATGLVHTEQHGVPQTRTRAILVARLDGKEARLPTPTHSRFYPQDPARLDRGVKPWVTMAEALGWEAEGYLRSNYGTSGDPEKRGERRLDQPAPTITGKANRNALDKWRFLGAGGTSPTTARVRPRPLTEPASTITGARSAGFATEDGWRGLSATEAAVLQTYPADFAWVGGINATMQQIGNAVPPLLAEAILKEFL
jgi:DNA (cytosine-5)-methyltransferase 1